MKKIVGKIVVLLLASVLLAQVLSTNILKISPAKGYLNVPGFNHPEGIAMDSDDWCYVADTQNNKVKAFVYGNTEPFWSADAPLPVGVAVDEYRGEALVTCPSSHEVMALDWNTGELLWDYVGYLDDAYPNFAPSGIAVDQFSGDIYITDPVNNVVYKTYETEGGLGPPTVLSHGFNGPLGVALDTEGNVYVADTGNNKIQLFHAGAEWYEWGSPGSGDGQFNSPHGIAVDGSEIYVADTGNNRIQKFYTYFPIEEDPYIGVFNWAFDSDVFLEGTEFSSPEGVVLNSFKDLYVADTGKNRVQSFIQYKLALHSGGNPPGQSPNYVNPYEGVGTYPEGSAVTIHAVATGSYIFTNWSGDLTGSENPTTINIAEEMNVFANFVDSANLLENPGFESVVEGIPTGWSGNMGGESSYFYSAADVPPPRSGYYSCMGVEYNAENLGRFHQDVTSVTTPGNAYQISGWIKTGLMSGEGSVIIGLDYVDGDGVTQQPNWYVREIGQATADQDWKFFQSDVFTLLPMPTDASALWFLLDFNNVAGTAYFDDVSLIQVSAGGLNIASTVDDPSLITEPWSYLLTYPDGYTESFTLPAGGGSTLLPITQSGDYSIAQTRKLNYATSTTVDGIDVPATEVANRVSLTLSNLDAGDAVSVVFNNVLVPDVAWAKPAGGGDSTQNSASTYNMPCRKAVPVQVSWDPDIEPNQELDIVKDRPIKIMVNLADLLTSSGPLGAPLAPTDSVTVSVTCTPAGFFVNPLEYSATRTGAQISSNNVIIFNMNPPSTIGHYTITCTTTHGADTLSTIFTLVKVRETAPLSLYYSHLYRVGDYGTEPATAFDTMLTNSRDFVKAVYPVSGLTVGSNANGIPGEAYQANYIGMLKDCQRIAQEAKLSFPNSPNAIGVAIGPDLGGGGYSNYFAYHGAVSGKKTAVGVSFGPAVKGVVALDGYYSAVAHEIGHTFGLYYGVPEQYTVYNPGAPANGFWVEQNQWRSGYDFMGLSSHESTTSTWVSTETTFVPLFNGLKTSGDPQIILVNGIIYKDTEGHTSAELPLTWYRMPYGTADTIPTGEVSRFELKFTKADGSIVQVPFDAQFYLNLDPGIEAGEDLPLDTISGEVPTFGSIPVNFAGFAFATEYPTGTVRIDLVDTFQAGQVIATKYAGDVVSALSAGFGGFVPPVKEGASFKKGTAVPVKFQLTTPSGAFITTAQARLFLYSLATGEIAATSLPASTTGNLFRYDVAKNQYIFNLDTRSLATGTWQLRVYLGDGTPPKTVNIKIR